MTVETNKGTAPLAIVGAHPDRRNVVADVAIGPVTLRDVRIGPCYGDCTDPAPHDGHLVVHWTASADLDDEAKGRMFDAMEAEYERRVRREVANAAAPSTAAAD